MESSDIFFRMLFPYFQDFIDASLFVAIFV